MKRLLMLIIMMGIISLCLGAFACTCFADGAPLTINGETAFPINNNSVKLESEVINIFYDTGEDGDIHTAEVVFNFENTGDETEVEFGFPNIVQKAEQRRMNFLEMRNFKVFHYPSMESIDCELLEGGSLPWYSEYRFGSYFNWKLSFKQNEKKSIKVTYDFFGYRSAGYILRTGALWKDDIDKVDIYVHFNEPAAHAGIYASPHDYYYNGEGIEWHYEDIEPDFDIFVHYDPLGKNITPDERFYEPVQANIEDKYDWDQRLFYIKTRGDYSSLALGTKTIYETSLVVDPILHIRGIIKGRLEICKSIKNEILARNGYVFTDEKYKDIFEDLSWYEPNPSFSLDDLNFIEKININTIEEFEEMINLDVSDDKLLEDFKEYYSLYDDGKNLDDDYWMDQEIYFHEPLKINIDFNSVLERGYGDYEIEEYKNLFKDYASKENNTILPEKYDIHYVDESSDNCPHMLRSEIHMEYQDYYLDSEKLLFECISDNNKYLCKYTDKNFYKICNLNTLPPLKGISPNGNYILFGDMIESTLFEGRIYLLSTKNGRSFMIGRGDYIDYEFNWSSNGDCLCFYKSNGKGDEVTVFNGEKNYFKKVKFNQKAIDSAHTNSNGDVVVQSKGKIYLLENNSSNWINIVSGTNLIGFDSNSDDVLNYYDTNIYQYNKSNDENVLVARTYVSIWDTELSKNGNYHLHAGRDTLYVYCSKTNLLYRYDDMTTDSIIQESPKGEYLLISPKYAMWGEINDEYIIDAEIGEKRILDYMREERYISWYDEKTLIGLKTLEKYTKYDVEMDKVEYEINFMDRYISEEITTLIKKRDVKNTALLKKDINVKSYQDGRLLNFREDKMLGIIKDSDANGGEYLAYVIDDDALLKKIYVDKDSCEQLLNKEGITDAIIYNAKVYNEPDRSSELLVNECTSEIRIMDSKNDWYYININNKCLGWIEKTNVLYDFDNFITEEVSNTDEKDTKQHRVTNSEIQVDAIQHIDSDKDTKEVHQDNSENNTAGFIVLGLMFLFAMSGTILNLVVVKR